MRSTLKANKGAVYVTAAEKETTPGRVGVVLIVGPNGDPAQKVLGLDLDPHQAAMLADELARAAQIAFRKVEGDQSRIERAALKAA